ncbi:MAG TPA: hypothetical protein VFB78_15975 [Acidimicrobiales bacterium]|nr:hypothetical protein [Acidimicrobiales bacterium]
MPTSDLADAAFAHCWVVLADPDAAAAAAIAALRRAGRSRPSVLAHARYQALESTGQPASPPADTPAPDDLQDLAALLASTRPAAERAILDLRSRLDRAGLGRALGLPAVAAAARADTIGDAWDRELDPLLIARLGPGDCPELAVLLADADLSHPSLGDLTAIAPAVAAHVAACDACTDRQRAMVSVRALLSQRSAPDTPGAVREAARRSRRMRPAAPPPPIEPSRRRPLVIAAIVAGVIALVVGVAATAAAITGSRNDRAGRVAKLVHVPAGADLALTVRRDVIEIANRSRRTLTWRATAEARWLQIRPHQGELRAGETRVLTTRVLTSSPEGRLRTTVTVTGDDGSAAAAAYQTTVERPPDLAASVDGCTVTATVEDVSGVSATTLYWKDGRGEHQAAMTATPAGYTTELPESTPLTWWVVAADTRGNQARTPELQGGC